jgi:hypothetical protein
MSTTFEITVSCDLNSSPQCHRFVQVAYVEDGDRWPEVAGRIPGALTQTANGRTFIPDDIPGWYRGYVPATGQTLDYCPACRQPPHPTPEQEERARRSREWID